MREELTAATKEKENKSAHSYVRVFCAFRAALTKEKVVKEKKETAAKENRRSVLCWVRFSAAT